jgi:hypothetical protein
MESRKHSVLDVYPRHIKVYGTDTTFKCFFANYMEIKNLMKKNRPKQNSLLGYVLER